VPADEVELASDNRRSVVALPVEFDTA